MEVYIVHWTTGDNDVCLGSDDLADLIGRIGYTMRGRNVYCHGKRVGWIVGMYD